MKMGTKIWGLLTLFSFSVNATEQTNRLSDKQFEKAFNAIEAKMDQLPQDLRARVNDNPCEFCELVLQSYNHKNEEWKQYIDDLQPDKRKNFYALIGFCVKLKEHQNFCKNPTLTKVK